MGQKTHPLGFRLGITQDHRSQWYAKPTEYAQNVQEDQLVRAFLLKQLGTGAISTSASKKPSSRKPTAGDAGLSKTILSRRGDKLLIEVHVAQPKIVTGEAGSRLKELTLGIQKIQKDYRTQCALQQYGRLAGNELQAPDASPVSLAVVQVEQPATDATLLAQKVAKELEKRVAFRRIIKQSIKEAREAGVEGIKIQISGRLNGAEIARIEWAREGRVPLHTLRANIDYSAHAAHTIYGALGIKIWIYKTK